MSFLLGDFQSLPSQPEHISVGKSGICGRVVGILLDSLLEILNRLLRSLLGKLLPGIAAFQIELISLRIVGMRARQPLFRLAAQRQSKLFRHVKWYLPLQSKKLGHLPVVMFAPDMTVIPGIDQFETDSQGIVSPDQTAREHGFNGKLSSDSARISLPIFVMEYRTMRHHL